MYEAKEPNAINGVVKPEGWSVRKPPPFTTVESGPAPESRAAKGDDDLMSQPPPPAEAKGGWQLQVGAAKAAWDKLTEEEILQSDGKIQKLADLLEARYAVTRDDAERQVMQFFDKHMATY